MVPYKIPKYLPMRVFSLEYIRKMIDADKLHFVSTKKKSQFRIKSQIGPFICNRRVAGAKADGIPKEMKFTHSFTWSYDPMGIILKKRVQHKCTPYIHTPRPKIEKCMNQKEWVVDTLHEVEEKFISTSGIQTLAPQERETK